VLRCAGTAPMVDRVATADTTLLGRAIPKGTVVMSIVAGPSTTSPPLRLDGDDTPRRGAAATHRAWNPRGIGEFRPERWLGADGAFDPAAGPQLAFGLGVRGCYGKRLAYLEMRIVLTLVLWNFELMRCPEELSGYFVGLVATTEPRQCFVRLREL
jgi:cytochrome P450